MVFAAPERLRAGDLPARAPSQRVKTPGSFTFSWYPDLDSSSLGIGPTRRLLGERAERPRRRAGKLATRERRLRRRCPNPNRSSNTTPAWPTGRRRRSPTRSPGLPGATPKAAKTLDPVAHRRGRARGRNQGREAEVRDRDRDQRRARVADAARAARRRHRDRERRHGRLRRRLRDGAPRRRQERLQLLLSAGCARASAAAERQRRERQPQHEEETRRRPPPAASDSPTGSVNQTVLPLGWSTTPQRSAVASTISSPRPEGWAGAGDSRPGSPGAAVADLDADLAADRDADLESGAGVLHAVGRQLRAHQLGQLGGFPRLLAAGARARIAARR